MGITTAAASQRLRGGFTRYPGEGNTNLNHIKSRVSSRHSLGDLIMSQGTNPGKSSQFRDLRPVGAIRDLSVEIKLPTSRRLSQGQFAKG